jgi:hypothetical protein
MHFRKAKPYKVFEYYDKNHHYNIDYKGLYYDEELKSYLLKWLDIDAYIDYKLEKYKEDIRNSIYDDMNKLGHKNYSLNVIKRYINECKLNYDSICSIPEFYAEYKDKTIEWLVDQERKKILQNKDNIIPPDGAIYLHTRIAYSEAYIFIKQFEKRLNHKKNWNSYLEYLLKMNDPETQAKYDEIIKEFINTNGYSIEPINILETLDRLGYWGNAYAIEKLIEIYQVKRKYIPIETEHFFDKDVLIKLLSMCKYNNIETKYPIYEIDILNEKEIRKYSKEILEAANKLVEKLKEKEKYWMDNMPFNKNK